MNKQQDWEQEFKQIAYKAYDINAVEQAVYNIVKTDKLLDLKPIEDEVVKLRQAIMVCSVLLSQQDHQWIEAVEGIIGEDDPDWRKAVQHSGIMWTSGRNELRKEMRQRLKDYIKTREI